MSFVLFLYTVDADSLGEVPQVFPGSSLTAPAMIETELHMFAEVALDGQPDLPARPPIEQGCEWSGKDDKDCKKP